MNLCSPRYTEHAMAGQPSNAECFLQSSTSQRCTSTADAPQPRATSDAVNWRVKLYVRLAFVQVKPKRCAIPMLPTARSFLLQCLSAQAHAVSFFTTVARFLPCSSTRAAETVNRAEWKIASPAQQAGCCQCCVTHLVLANPQQREAALTWQTLCWACTPVICIHTQRSTQPPVMQSY
jgi:hypothetical protein